MVQGGEAGPHRGVLPQGRGGHGAALLSGAGARIPPVPASPRAERKASGELVGSFRGATRYCDLTGCSRAEERQGVVRRRERSEAVEVELRWPKFLGMWRSKIDRKSVV